MNEVTATRRQPSAPSPLEQDESLAVLLDVSRELTAILERDELFRRIAERVKLLFEVILILKFYLTVA